MKNVKNIKWNASYDVLVLGFGGAGGTAARFAADNNAHVLLVDSASLEEIMLFYIKGGLAE